MEYGVQLFGCMEIFRKDPEDFLRRAAETGYKFVEPCVSFGEFSFPGGNFNPVLNTKELELYAKAAASYGLRVESFHAFGDLLANMKELNKVINAYGIKHVIPAGVGKQNIEDTVKMLKAAAAGIKESGAKICVHNGANIISEKIDGKSFLEAALERCGGEAGAQLDVGWALYGGEEPLAYMKKIEKYLWSLHYKDLKKDYKNLPAGEIHVCLGEGCLGDVRGIFDFARGLGIPQLIDQDKSDVGMMLDLEKSIKLLRSME